MTTLDTGSTDRDYDVAVVGGGPAGATAAMFCGRYGLETVVFDRGRSSIARCAHLENFPGFPAGIDIETFYGLIHDQIRESGAEIVAESVDAVERLDGTSGFRLTTAEGGATSACRVVAATRYDGSYSVHWTTTRCSRRPNTTARNRTASTGRTPTTTGRRPSTDSTWHRPPMRPTIATAHRLSTISDADTIVVLDDVEVVRSGGPRATVMPSKTDEMEDMDEYENYSPPF